MWDAITGLVSSVGPLSGPLKLAGGILEALVNYRMWRSLGWLLLGLVLLTMGFLLLNRKGIEGAAGTAAKAAVL